jgi:predicted regulator of amino acid metabolism with ACT domain
VILEFKVLELWDKTEGDTAKIAEAIGVQQKTIDDVVNRIKNSGLFMDLE